MESIKIGKKTISRNGDVFFIVEAGVNHNGDINIAKKLVDAAVHVNADAIKFQTFITEDLVQNNTPMAQYQKNNLKSSGSQFEMLKKLELPLDDFKILKAYCDERGIIFLSTPHTGGKVIDFLDKLMPAFKIGSGDLTNHPILKIIARKQKPMIIGTGMATLEEVQDAVKVIEKEGNEKIILLHCTTDYPCLFEEVNLKAMVTLQNSFPYPVGYSDHTNGTQVPVMAVTLGATVIEKHFTLDKTMVGPDHKASADPTEMAEVIKSCRNVKLILGSSEKKPNEIEKKHIPIVRKSLFFARDLEKGAILGENDFIIQRPGDGVSPIYLESIEGKKLKVPVKARQKFEFKFIQ